MLKTNNKILLGAAKGEWTAIEAQAEALIAVESEYQSQTGEEVVVSKSSCCTQLEHLLRCIFLLKTANNLAVSLLAQGKVKKAIATLEQTLNATPTACTSTEPFLFNLSTLYELRAGLAAHRKRELLVETAKWSGDGVRVACLKM